MKSCTVKPIVGHPKGVPKPLFHARSLLVSRSTRTGWAETDCSRCNRLALHRRRCHRKDIQDTGPRFPETENETGTRVRGSNPCQRERDRNTAGRNCGRCKVGDRVQPGDRLAQWPTEIEFDHSARHSISASRCNAARPLVLCLGTGRVFVSLL